LVVNFPDVAVELERDGLRAAGPADQLQGCFERGYDRSVAGYFNVSSKKQDDDARTYNFYLDTSTQTFVTFPKKRAAGVALSCVDQVTDFGSRVTSGASFRAR